MKRFDGLQKSLPRLPEQNRGERPRGENTTLAYFGLDSSRRYKVAVQRPEYTECAEGIAYVRNVLGGTESINPLAPPFRVIDVRFEAKRVSADADIEAKPKINGAVEQDKKDSITIQVFYDPQFAEYQAVVVSTSFDLAQYDRLEQKLKAAAQRLAKSVVESLPVVHQEAV